MLFPDLDARDTKRDAFRHAYWSALNAFTYNRYLAKQFGDAHEEEEDPNQTEEGRQMDIYNNSKGYDIGEYARNQGYALEWIEQEVLYYLDNGLLMVIKE